jgi:uncharacterized Fe-S cluster-containing protein
MDPLYDDAYLRGVAIGFPEGDSRRETMLRIADRVQRDQADAKRYRFLRDVETEFAVLLPRKHGHIAFMGEALDTHIDAVRVRPNKGE